MLETLKFVSTLEIIFPVFTIVRINKLNCEE